MHRSSVLQRHNLAAKPTISERSVAYRLVVAEVTVEIGRSILAPEVFFSLGVREQGAAYQRHSRAQHAERLLSKPPVRIARIELDRFVNARAARDWALNNLRGRHHNRDTNWEIAVTRSGIEKTLSSKGHGGAVHVQAIGSLRVLLGNAVLVESRPPRTPDASIKSIHRLYAAALVEETLYRVKITVKEILEAHNFYDQSLTRIEQSPAAGGALSRESEENRAEPGEPVSCTAAISAAEGVTGPEDLKITIAQLLNGVKYEDGGYVLKPESYAVREPSLTRRTAPRHIPHRG